MVCISDFYVITCFLWLMRISILFVSAVLISTPMFSVLYGQYPYPSMHILILHCDYNKIYTNLHPCTSQADSQQQSSTDPQVGHLASRRNHPNSYRAQAGMSQPMYRSSSRRSWRANSLVQLLRKQMSNTDDWDHLGHTKQLCTTVC